jgi:hypothetical protein
MHLVLSQHDHSLDVWCVFIGNMKGSHCACVSYAHRVVCVCDGHVRVYTIYVSAIDSEKAQPRCKKANFESVLLTGSSTLQYTAPELPYLCVCGPECVDRDFQGKMAFRAFGPVSVARIIFTTPHAPLGPPHHTART